MNLKWRFILFGGLFFSSYGLILFEVLKQNKWIFLTGEILLVGMIVLFVILYQQFLKPIHTISSGISLLKEKNFSSYLKKVGQPEVDGIVEVYNQMIEELRQERLQKEEQNYFLDLLLEASPIGVIILDLEERIFQVNTPALHQLAADSEEEVKGKKLGELKNALATELAEIDSPQSGMIQLDGMNIYQVHRKYFMDRGSQRPFYIIEDLTREWLRFEKQAYEKVIRMMSHEVNNTVGSINSVLGSLYNYHRNNDDEASGDIQEALEASIERNKNLNRFMSNYASVVKIPEPQPEKINLNELVNRVLLLFQSDFQERSIHVETHLSGQSPIICADPPQLEQVLVNILKNSMEAIEKQGAIKISTTVSPAKINILDNGTGISDMSKNKIFTPFYSEKKNGQGIGLTFIREVLLSHKFMFSLSSNDEGWTDFQIKFE